MRVKFFRNQRIVLLLVGFMVIFFIFCLINMIRRSSRQSQEVLENFLINEFCGEKAFGVSKCSEYYLVDCGSFVDLPQYIVDENGEVLCTISWGKWYCSPHVNPAVLKSKMNECEPIWF